MRPRLQQSVLLDDETIERLARRVAELLSERERSASATGPDRPGRLLSAAQVAERWQIDREWVYAHADELGAMRLGTGPRPRLRFDPARIAERLTSTSSDQSQDQRSRVRLRP